jgi:hypothetical protein
MRILLSYNHGMAGRRGWMTLFVAAITAGAFIAGAQQFRQNRWARYEREMQDPVDDPPDADEKTEFVFGRLRFRSPRDGWSYSRWGIDCNKSDRQFLMGFERLTRVHARSIEEIVDIDSDTIFEWPWLLGVAIGDWVLSEEQAQRLRKYFDRGGFMMVDDFHGESEWHGFMTGLKKIFPNPTWVELENDHPMFHVVYDLTNRVQIPGANVVHGPGYERGGVVPHWRGVLDDKGRVMIAVCFNMDVGDAWEFADDPGYPERFASEAYRLGINYTLYAMTH